MDCYEILGIDRNADAVSVRSAYRRLARRYHPDLSPEGDCHRFLEVHKAYETLSDPELRATYDRSLNQQIPVRIIRSTHRKPEPEPLIPHHPIRISWVHPGCSLESEDDPFEEIFHLMARFLRGE